MNEYRQSFYINDSHADYNRVCKISSLFNFVQTVSTEHFISMPIYQTLQYQYKGDFGIILTSIWGRFYRPLNYGENLSVVTHQRPVNSGKIYRDFDFYVGDCLVGEAITSLVIMDLKTRQLIKTTRFAELLNQEACKEECKNKILAKVKGRKSVFTDKYCVKYSDSDKNRHMNNIRYAEIICDTINMEMHHDEYISQMQIDFYSECYIGTKLSIYTGKDYNEYFVRGLDEHSKTKFVAYTMLDKIKH